MVGMGIGHGWIALCGRIRRSAPTVGMGIGHGWIAPCGRIRRSAPTGDMELRRIWIIDCGRVFLPLALSSLHVQEKLLQAKSGCCRYKNNLPAIKYGGCICSLFCQIPSSRSRPHEASTDGSAGRACPTCRPLDGPSSVTDIAR